MSRKAPVTSALGMLSFERKTLEAELSALSLTTPALSGVVADTSDDGVSASDESASPAHYRGRHGRGLEVPSPQEREIQLLEKMVVVLRVAGEHDEALKYAGRWLTACERAHGKNSVAVAMALRSMAGIYRMRFTTRSSAKAILLRALGILVRCLGERHQHIVDTLTSLAVLCNSEGNVSEAETYNARAVEMFYELCSNGGVGSELSPRPMSIGSVASDTSMTVGASAGSPRAKPPAWLVAAAAEEAAARSPVVPAASAPSPSGVGSDEDSDDEVCDDFKTFEWLPA